MATRKGISTLSRDRLSRLLRAESGLITVAAAARHLSLSQPHAAHELARLARAGWLARVRRGAYTPVPLEAASADIALEDSWAAAASLFAPCYIAGWSAAEHWGLTEQVFRSVCIVTASKPRKRDPVLRGTQFILRSLVAEKIFGTKSIWRGRVRVQVSDPARTLVDMLGDPSLGGGIRPVADMLGVLLQEQREYLQKLIDYGARVGNAAVFKRLGFLLESKHDRETTLITSCRERLSTGYAKLDAELTCDKLVTAWNLWVPASWRPSKRA